MYACLAEVRMNIFVFAWCTECGSWSEFSYVLTCGLLVCLFGLSIFVSMCVFVSMFVIVIVCVYSIMSVVRIVMVVLAVFFTVLVMFAMFGDQFFCVRDFVDAIFGVLTVFESKVMRVDDDLL